jgi:hypothetical protein
MVLEGRIGVHSMSGGGMPGFDQLINVPFSICCMMMMMMIRPT